MLWTRHPNLCFDVTKDQSTDEDCVEAEIAKFVETVNSVVQQHSGAGLNKFSIRCSLQKKNSDNLDRWIRFATAAKSKIIDINLWSKKKIGRAMEEVYHFPLEALGDHNGPFYPVLVSQQCLCKAKLKYMWPCKTQKALFGLFK